MATRRITLVNSDHCSGHDSGVREALHRKGVRATRERLATKSGMAPNPAAFKRADAALFSDILGTYELGALRMANATGVRTALVMDGVLEPANTFINPGAGPSFLRPAPVDLVCAAGPLDRAALLALGNDRVVATGLPRLEQMRSFALDRTEDRTITVATARTPAFNEIDHARIANLMCRIRDAASALDVAVRWRIDPNLCNTLGVEHDNAPLKESIKHSSAVLSTPSTLVVEALLAGRPTALLQPHPRSLWQTAPWVWRDRAASPTEIDCDLDTLAAPATDACLATINGSLDPASTTFEGDLPTLIEDLLAPNNARIEMMAMIADLLAIKDPAENIAEALIELASDSQPYQTKAVPSVVSMPTPPKPTERPTVVSCVVCEGSTVGGVQNWSARLGQAFAERPDLDYDVHTLYIAAQPLSFADPRAVVDPLDDHQHLLVLDPTADIHETLDLITETIRRFNPDIVLPNFADISYTAATRLRSTGVRTVAIAHTDDDYYRQQINFYNRWDAAVAVSETCLGWLSALAGPRPVSRITYGVPIPPAARPPSPPDHPITLAYIGRMVEDQKRVSRLVPLAEALRNRGVKFRLELAGDGSSLEHLRTAFSASGFTSHQIHFHGAIPFDKIKDLLAITDLSILVSDTEGTSISMLEAMAAGVVPCVSDVASGVRDWINPDENGLVAPVGDIEGMADAIAKIDQDRERLTQLSLAARATVELELTTERMAERYADVFDSTLLADPTADLPTDRVANLHDPWRSRKPAPEHPDAADAWCHAALRSAGYRSIANDLPGPDSDAVVIRSGSHQPTEDQVEMWRAAGLGIAFSPTLLWNPGLERARRRLVELLQPHGARIAIYGCGTEARMLLSAIANDTPIVGFIDDAAEPGEKYLDRPMVRLDQADVVLKPEVIAIASSKFEQVMWKNLSYHPRVAHVRRVPLFSEIEQLEALTPA